jgi:two-component system chemotaxis response regulator CheY
MKTLVVDDDFTNRLLLQEILKVYGPTHIAINGKEAVEAVAMALQAGEAYDLICLDIMMPGVDGHQALREIRAGEDRAGIVRGDGAKIVMTTSIDDKDHVHAAFKEHCDAYIVKPIDRRKFLGQLRELGLID